MVGPDDVIELKVFGVEALLDPFRPGAVHEAFLAVTHGAGFPASVAPDATARFLLEELPALIRRHLFEGLQVGVILSQGPLLDWIGHQDVGLRGISVAADLAGRVKEVLPP
jgi:hypothetical protein